MIFLKKETGIYIDSSHYNSVVSKLYFQKSLVIFINKAIQKLPIIWHLPGDFFDLPMYWEINVYIMCVCVWRAYECIHVHTYMYVAGYWMYSVYVCSCDKIMLCGRCGWVTWLNRWSGHCRSCWYSAWGMVAKRVEMVSTLTNILLKLVLKLF